MDEPDDMLEDVGGKTTIWLTFCPTQGAGKRFLLDHQGQPKLYTNPRFGKKEHIFKREDGQAFEDLKSACKNGSEMYPNAREMYQRLRQNYSHRAPAAAQVCVEAAILDDFLGTLAQTDTRRVGQGHFKVRFRVVYVLNFDMFQLLCDWISQSPEPLEWLEQRGIETIVQFGATKDFNLRQSVELALRNRLRQVQRAQQEQNFLIGVSLSMASGDTFVQEAPTESGIFQQFPLDTVRHTEKLLQFPDAQYFSMHDLQTLGERREGEISSVTTGCKQITFLENTQKERQTTRPQKLTARRFMKHVAGEFVFEVGVAAPNGWHHWYHARSSDGDARTLKQQLQQKLGPHFVIIVLDVSRFIDKQIRLPNKISGWRIQQFEPIPLKLSPGQDVVEAVRQELSKLLQSDVLSLCVTINSMTSTQVVDTGTCSGEDSDHSTESEPEKNDLVGVLLEHVLIVDSVGDDKPVLHLPPLFVFEIFESQKWPMGPTTQSARVQAAATAITLGIQDPTTFGNYGLVFSARDAIKINSLLRRESTRNVKIAVVGAEKYPSVIPLLESLEATPPTVTINHLFFRLFVSRVPTKNKVEASSYHGFVLFVTQDEKLELHHDGIGLCYVAACHTKSTESPLSDIETTQFGRRFVQNDFEDKKQLQNLFFMVAGQIDEYQQTYGCLDFHRVVSCGDELANGFGEDKTKHKKTQETDYFKDDIIHFQNWRLPSSPADSLLVVAVGICLLCALLFKVHQTPVAVLLTSLTHILFIGIVLYSLFSHKNLYETCSNKPAP